MAFKEDTSAILFVTVGTTRFDELIKVISKEILLKSLKKNFGINRVIAQIGMCPYLKFYFDFFGKNYIIFSSGNSFVYDIQEAKEKFKEWMVIEIYRFKPDIREDLLKADYIISHAGSYLICRLTY
jgi:UDP-N-acetylglucosamine transferase subunit ALG13